MKKTTSIHGLKTVKYLGIGEDFLNLVNSIYEKSAINIIVNGETLNFFLIRLGTRQIYILSTLPFITVLEVLARTVRQEKLIKVIETENEKVQQSLFAANIILYVENPRECTKQTKPKSNLVELINEFSKVTRYKVKIPKRKSIVFLYTRKK